jgi:hypothetical protein
VAAAAGDRLGRQRRRPLGGARQRRHLLRPHPGALPGLHPVDQRQHRPDAVQKQQPDPGARAAARLSRPDPAGADRRPVPARRLRLRQGLREPADHRGGDLLLASCAGRTRAGRPCGSSRPIR